MFLVNPSEFFGFSDTILDPMLSSLPLAMKDFCLQDHTADAPNFVDSPFKAQEHETPNESWRYTQQMEDVLRSDDFVDKPSKNSCMN